MLSSVHYIIDEQYKQHWAYVSFFKSSKQNIELRWIGLRAPELLSVVTRTGLKPGKIKEQDTTSDGSGKDFEWIQYGRMRIVFRSDVGGEMDLIYELEKILDLRLRSCVARAIKINLISKMEAFYIRSGYMAERIIIDNNFEPQK